VGVAQADEVTLKKPNMAIHLYAQGKDTHPSRKARKLRGGSPSNGSEISL